MTQDFKTVFEDLNKLLTASLQEIQDLEENDPCRDIHKNENPIEYKLAALYKTWAKDWYKGLVNIKNDLAKHIKQVPVLGYNSAHYDINLIKQHPITTLIDD